MKKIIIMASLFAAVLNIQAKVISPRRAMQVAKSATEINADILTFAETAVEADGEAQVAVSLRGGSQQYVSLQYDIRLPEGIEPVTDSDCRVVISKGTGLGDDAIADCEKQTDGSYRFILYSPSNAPIADGTIFTFGIAASPTMASGSHAAIVTGILLTTTDLQKVAADDTTATITVTPSTAIDGMPTTVSTSADTYNLQGMKVGTGYKGVVIRGGKKMLNR